MQKVQSVIFNKGDEYNPIATVSRASNNKLDMLARESARVIVDVKAVFPFNFFPDEVILDETKVSVHISYFFWSKEVRSIEYKDIFNVAVQQGLFFAKLEIVDRFFTQSPITINYLFKKDAHKIRRLIQGMMIAQKEQIDIHDMPLKELVAKLERIGRSR